MGQKENFRATELASALSSQSSSQRLAAVLAAGTNPDDAQVELLIERCSIEPDFFVRDMLTWALLRHNQDTVYPKLLDELQSPLGQAKSQALHTLTKIGYPDSWKLVSDELIFNQDVEVARAAWRLAVNLSPETEHPSLVIKLSRLLGKGDEDIKLSLSRALAQLGELAKTSLVELAGSDSEEISNHATFTLELIDNPDIGQSHSARYATKMDLLSGAPNVPNDDAISN